MQFNSFLYKNHCHIIDVHKDAERYPHHEDTDYTFMPRPWPSEIPFPSRELWYYFMRPDDCGTSTALNKMLPIKVVESSHSRMTAFGIFIEEGHSVIALCIPPLIIFLFTISATFWFVPQWLKEHPDDLQNATTPTITALTVVSFPIQLFISVLLFRWTNA